ncbi:MAG TPA: heme ABC transporter ATP-binding protein [Saprospiraceae bacterium]|nr:heme ABC transporter ATP-binding protein [Saprospiraceae bacterium]
MIQAQQVTIQKGKKNIVRDASFCIQPGQITVAIGKNGAGKSTLLEALTGRNTCQQGQIIWDKQQMSSLSLQELAQRRAVLSQKVEVSFPIPVRELVEMGCYAASVPLTQKETQNIVRKALSEVNMLNFRVRDFRTLSGGEQKRVLLAKAIAQLHSGGWTGGHKYIFLDEPTASLDIQQQFKLLKLVKRMVQHRKVGVFAVLHDINLAAQFADQILLLKNGYIRYQGSPAEVLTTEKLKAGMGINTLVHRHPVFDCPYVLSLPDPIEQRHFVLPHLGHPRSASPLGDNLNQKSQYG